MNNGKKCILQEIKELFNEKMLLKVRFLLKNNVFTGMLLICCYTN